MLVLVLRNASFLTNDKDLVYSLRRVAYFTGTPFVRIFVGKKKVEKKVEKKGRGEY